MCQSGGAAANTGIIELQVVDQVGRAVLYCWAGWEEALS